MTTQSQVLAGPPGDCCLKGVKHFGNPSGEIITIAGIQTYISKPPPPPAKLEDGSSSEQLEDKKKIILFLADVYGPFFINAQLLQNYYASQGLFTISIHPIPFLLFGFSRLGFTVLGIDYFFGDPMHLHTEEGFNRDAYLAMSLQRAKNAFPAWLKEVREIYGIRYHY